MARRTWDVRLDDGRHRITLDHGHWTGKIEITVDGRVIERTRKYLEGSLRGVDSPFRIGDHWLAVAIRPSGLGYRYDLFLNARSVDTGKLAEPIERHQRPMARLWLQLLPVVAVPGFLAVSHVIPSGVAPIIVGGLVGGSAALLAGAATRVLDRVEADQSGSRWMGGLTTVGVIVGAYAGALGLLAASLLVAVAIA